MKRILITGKDSYIGTSFEKWLLQSQFSDMYQIDTLDMRDSVWKEKDFSLYDAVFHVAGIAHADISKVTEEQKKLYYHVNCDLAIETAKKAKACGVKQFIYMSSIIVYGEGSSIRKKRIITNKTRPKPSSFYGDSKWKAEQGLEGLKSADFKIAILRPPMIYGKGSKGNYPVLSKMAARFPLFPKIKNERSILYIGNLCECIRLLIESVEDGVFFPQNAGISGTSQLVRQIASIHNKRIWITPVFNWGIYILGLCPGKIGKMINKAFGSLAYEKNLSAHLFDGRYQVFNLEQSLQMTELSEGKQ